MLHTPTDFLKVANKTAEHFGFKTADQLKKNPLCKKCETTMPHTVTGTNKKTDSRGGLLCSGIATFCDEKLHATEKPVLLYTVEQVPRTGETAVTFHIFNVEKSIAEAILIHTTRTLASELGHKDTTVKINSLGDSDSLTRYTREITNFLKKRLDTMPSSARELMKEHPLKALSNLAEQGHELASSSPNSLEHLSDSSRKHFREIVEYLEMSDTTYEIDSKMLANHECYSDAIFSLEVNMEDEDTESPITIHGGRFDEFAHRTTNEKIPAVGAVVVLKGSKAPARSPRLKATKPSVYVVHLGFGPKIRGLMLLDTLRKSSIPVYHSLTSNSLSEQLRDAEARNVKYTIIIGQKEFAEDTVILRDMEARKQEYLDEESLLKQLKRKSLVVA